MNRNRVGTTAMGAVFVAILVGVFSIPNVRPDGVTLGLRHQQRGLIYGPSAQPTSSTEPTSSAQPTSSTPLASSGRLRPGRQPSPAVVVGGTPPPGGLGAGAITICGTHFCLNGAPWYLYGTSEYESTHMIGIDYPGATIALARQARLNTIRIINFYNEGNPSVTPYDQTMWQKVDLMIADAKAIGMHVDLGLADYRRILWKNCINPYTYDWGQFIHFVASRRNTVTGATYGNDATIAFISLAGEPLPVGSHTFTTPSGASCTITYSGQDLLNFYTRTLAQWQVQGTTVFGNSGGLGYLNESNSGIPWQSIMALPTNRFCDIKTYGGMFAFMPIVAAYCHSINKPFMDEEYGWQQGMGDTQRAQAFHGTAAALRANGATGQAFWNLGEQMSTTGYDVGPGTPLTLASIEADAPAS